MPRGQSSGAGKSSQPPFEEDEPRQDGDEAEGPGAGHNSDAINKALAALLEKHCDLQDQEDVLIRKWIEPIRKKKQDVKATAKKEYDIPTAAFNARAGLRRVERSSEDEELTLATKKLFEALPIGESLDLVAMAERVAKKKADAAAKKNKANVTEEEVA